jgi:hypothetical protein
MYVDHAMSGHVLAHEVNFERPTSSSSFIHPKMSTDSQTLCYEPFDSTYASASIWGWVIYRTVYTPESEILWPRVINTINAYLAHNLRETLSWTNGEKNHAANMAKLENFWMSDTSLFNQATIEDLRIHFTSWLQTQDTEDEEGDKNLPHVRFCTFLVIDQCTLYTIANVPDPEGKGARGPMIKVFSAQRDERRSDKAGGSSRGRGSKAEKEGKVFPGWLNCRILYLRELWERVDEYMSLYEICPREFEDSEGPVWEPDEPLVDEHVDSQLEIEVK